MPLRSPKLFNLRRDPFERADENSNVYWNWVAEHVFAIYPAPALAAEQIQTFIDFPPVRSRRRSISTRSWRRCREHPRVVSTNGTDGNEQMSRETSGGIPTGNDLDPCWNPSHGIGGPLP